MAEPTSAEREAKYAPFMDEDAMRALAHPIRIAIFMESVHRPLSAKEAAEMLEQPLPKVSYHVRALADAGLLKPVRRTRRRGAIETHYRAAAKLEVSDDVWDELPDPVRESLLEAIVG